MYLSYVLADLAGRKPGAGRLTLDELPEGLEGYYERFWDDMQRPKTADWPLWNGLYRPVIERLAVAAESVTAEWLGAQIGRDPD